jgi:hypothetical protein
MAFLGDNKLETGANWTKVWVLGDCWIYRQRNRQSKCFVYRSSHFLRFALFLFLPASFNDSDWNWSTCLPISPNALPHEFQEFTNYSQQGLAHSYSWPLWIPPRVAGCSDKAQSSICLMAEGNEFILQKLLAFACFSLLLNEHDGAYYTTEKFMIPSIHIYLQCMKCTFY